LKVETKARILGLVSETSLNKLSQFLKNNVVTYCTSRLFQDESFTIRLSSLTWCKWSPSTWYWKCCIWYILTDIGILFFFPKQHSYRYSNWIWILCYTIARIQIISMSRNFMWHAYLYLNLNFFRNSILTCIWILCYTTARIQIISMSKNKIEPPYS
jgi:hypothetical protein